MTKKDTSYPQLSAVGHWGPYQMPAFRPPVVNPKSKEHNNDIFKAKLHLSIFARWHNHIPSASDELQALPGQNGASNLLPKKWRFQMSIKELFGVQTPASASNLKSTENQKAEKYHLAKSPRETSPNCVPQSPDAQRHVMKKNTTGW